MSASHIIGQTALLLLVSTASATPLPLQKLRALPREQPLLFGSALTCVKTLSSDVFVQRVALNRSWDEVDLRRIGVFAVFGALYLGGFQGLLYLHLYPRLLPLASKFAAAPLAAKLRDGPGLASVIGQVALDQGLHWPLCALPCFYMIKGIGARVPLRDTWAALRANWVSDVLVCWSIWVPGELINFGLMPMHWQLPFAALVSFVYTAVISYQRGERYDTSQAKSK